MTMLASFRMQRRTGRGTHDVPCLLVMFGVSHNLWPPVSDDSEICIIGLSYVFVAYAPYATYSLGVLRDPSALQSEKSHQQSHSRQGAARSDVGAQEVRACGVVTVKLEDVTVVKTELAGASDDTFGALLPSVEKKSGLRQTPSFANS